ncbi:MAG: hypothetical protein KC933_17425 [Myxococcales bacterium]|nr:hypothetical protein [Myxococcales bacterium]MCB9648868.1 hypothetical protein [Deltaproteobacteria bacterium]
MDIFSSAARVLHVLMVGLWMGAAALCLLLVYLVPDTLDSRQAAEAVLAATRARLDLYGVMAGPGALITLAVGWVPMNVPLRLRVFLCLAATGAAGFGGQYLLPRMNELMAAMGRPLEELPATDPLVGQYLELSTVSFVALAVQVAAAFLLTLTAVAAAKPKKRYGGLEF